MRGFGELNGNNANLAKRTGFVIAGWMCVLFLSSAPTLHAQQSGACQITDYKILTPQAVAISCSDLVIATGRTATVTTTTTVGTPSADSAF